MPIGIIKIGCRENPIYLGQGKFYQPQTAVASSSISTLLPGARIFLKKTSIPIRLNQARRVGGALGAGQLKFKSIQS